MVLGYLDIHMEKRNRATSGILWDSSGAGTCKARSGPVKLSGGAVVGRSGGRR